MKSQPVIKATALSKKYIMGAHEFYALRNIDLEIKQGEFIAVLGPSGSGKSTLLNLLGGFDRQTDGVITVYGHDLRSLSDKKMSLYRNKTVGFVFQSFHLNPSLTALENVAVPLIYARIKRSLRPEIAQEALNEVSLTDRMHHRPSQLSGGQRQRVSIARAIVNRPQIILADEPTGNLDSASGRRIIELLHKLKDDGYTIIMVTHNSKQAVSADRLIELRDGRIVKDVVQ